MDLSIVIVNWNTSDMLRNCLASLFINLDAVRAEVIVIDNASSDDSQQMVRKEFPVVSLICNPENVGFATATNQGLRLATGAYLLLLNSDTLIHGDVLIRSVEYMNVHADVGMMGCKVLNSDDTVQLTCSRYPTFINLLLQTVAANRLTGVAWLRRYQMLDWERDNEREVEVISGCYLVTRREVLVEIGLLDESFFLYAEETDWCRRCADAGWRLMFTPIGSITHFGSGSSHKLNYRRDLLLSEGLIRLHRKHGGLLAGIAMWVLLGLFSCTRSVYWSISALMQKQNKTLQRAEHFRQVVRHFTDAWPKSAEPRR